MGILFVLILYAIVLSLVAAIGAAVFGTAAHFATRSAESGHKRAVLIAALFPFLCVAFAGVWFVVYDVINDSVFHHDPGLGDSWYTPLPNGYGLMMIDTTDQGVVFNPKTQGGWGSVGSKHDTAFGARQLQIEGKRIFGARDSGYFDRLGKESSAVDTYFELDTDGDSPIEFKSIGQLRQRAASEGVTLSLRSFESVYQDYRITWFDYLAGAILLLVPFSGLLLLSLWVWRVRRRGQLS